VRIGGMGGGRGDGRFPIAGGSAAREMEEFRLMSERRAWRISAPTALPSICEVRRMMSKACWETLPGDTSVGTSRTSMIDRSE